MTRRPPITDPSELVRTEPEVLAFDPATTYVAFVIGDGDNIAYLQSTRAAWLRQRLDAEQTALVGNGNLGHSRKALDMGLATAALAESRLGPTDKATLTSRLNVATMRYYMGQLAEARAAFASLMPEDG